MPHTHYLSTAGEFPGALLSAMYGEKIEELVISGVFSEEEPAPAHITDELGTGVELIIGENDATLSNAEAASCRLSFDYLEGDEGVLYEMGGSGVGLLCSVNFSGKLCLVYGSGDLADERPSWTEITAPISPGTITVEWSVDLTNGKLWINGQLSSEEGGAITSTKICGSGAGGTGKMSGSVNENGTGSSLTYTNTIHSCTLWPEQTVASLPFSYESDKKVLQLPSNISLRNTNSRLLLAPGPSAESRGNTMGILVGGVEGMVDFSLLDWHSATKPIFAAILR